MALSPSTLKGDALDSNGTATISGGTVTLNGPSTSGNGPTDVVGDFVLSGGTLLAGGAEDNMFQSQADSSTQGYIVLSLSTALSTGDTVTDSSGNVVATYEVSKDGVNQQLISTANMTSGETYTVTSGDTELGTVTAE